MPHAPQTPPPARFLTLRPSPHDVRTGGLLRGAGTRLAGGAGDVYRLTL